MAKNYKRNYNRSKGRSYGAKGKKRNYSSKSRSGRSYSASEKASYKRGFLAGLFLAKKNKTVKSEKSKKRNASLLDTIRRYRERNLGVLYHNGKFYDTNFIDKPVEITKSELKELHKDYNYDGKRSDFDVAQSYVSHMRRKYGVFNREGKFLHMMGEDK